MVDVHTPKVRSRNMSAIKEKNTKPELLVRKFCHSQGLRYRLHNKSLPGTPDLVFPKYKCVVFVNGCFWHRHKNCKYSTQPKSNTEFWIKKFLENTERDKRNTAALSKLGWKVHVVWECEVKNQEFTNWLITRIKEES